MGLTAGSPFSTAGQDPLFGALPEERQLIGMGIPGLSLAESVSAYPTTSLAQVMQQRQMQALQSAGLPLDSNPNEWTPEEAGAQTDAAIAKIATVNPDLANQLQAQRTGQGESKGFWGSLLDLGGDIVAPVLQIGATALDILSRPAQIIPELLVDRENDSFWADVGQALSGNSTATWSDVLEEEWGIQNSWVNGIAGFGLDVLIDPINLVTFGTAGLGREIATRTIGEAAARAVLEKEGTFVGQVAKQLGKGTDEAVDEIVKQWVRSPAARAMDPMDLTARDGLLGWGLKSANEEVRLRVLGAYDEALKAGGTFGSVGAAQKAGHTLSGAASWEDIADVLKRQRLLGGNANAGGLFPTISREGVTGSAQAAGAAMGGMRFRLSVPFTDFRYVSAPIPYSTFGAGRRFMAGMSGQVQLLNMISDGHQLVEGIGNEVYRAWLEKGWSGLLNHADPRFRRVAAEMRSAGGGISSMFWTMSERVGRATAMVTPHARAFRGGGMVDWAVADMARLSRGWKDSMESAMWRFEREDGSIVEKEQFLDMAKVLRNQERTGLYNDFNDLIPDPQMKADDFRQMYDDEVIAPLQEAADNGTIGEAAFDEAMDKALEHQARGVRALSEITDDEREVLAMMRAQRERAVELGTLHGVHTPDWTIDADGAWGLNPGDADAIESWLGGAAPAVRDREFVISGSNVQGVGFSDSDIAAHGDFGRGIHGTFGGESVPPLRGHRIQFNASQRADALVDEAGNILGEDDYVILYHGTDADTAEKILNEGFKPGAKVQGPATVIESEAVAEMLHKKVGDTLGYEPKRGAGQGTYLAARPEYVAEVFGDNVLEVRVRVGDLLTAPERRKTGRVHPVRSVLLDDGYIEVPVEATNVRRYTPGAGEDVGARLRMNRPLVVDRRAVDDFGAPVLNDGSALYDEVLGGVDEALSGREEDILARLSNDGLSETDDIVRQAYLDEVAEKRAELITEALRARGHDGIVIVEEDGVIRATAFDADNVKLLADDAPLVRRTRGYSPRITTEAFRESVEGVLDEHNIRVLSGVSPWRRGMQREYREELVDEAERLLKRDLAEKVQLPQGMTIFERDVVHAHELYLRQMSNSIVKRQLGDFAGAIENLNDRLPALLGGPSRSVMSFGGGDIEALLRLPKMLEKRAGAYARAQQRLADREADLAAAIEQEAIGIGRAVEATGGRVATGGGQAGRREVQRLAGMVREATEAAAKAGKEYEKEVRRILGEINRAKKAAKAGDDVAAKLDDLTQQLAAIRKLAENRTPLSDAGAKARKATLRQVDAGETAREQAEQVVRNLSDRVLSEHLRVAAAQARMQDALDEFARVQASGRVRAAKASPAVAEGPAPIREGWMRLDIAGFDNVYMPAYVAQEFHSIVRGYPVINNPLHKEWKKFLTWWKGWATYRMPGFHLRNAQGAWFNNALGGVRTKHYVHAARIRKAASGSAKHMEMPVEEALVRAWGLTAYQRNLGRALTYGDMVEVMSGVGINRGSAGMYQWARLGSAELEASKVAAVDKLPKVGKWWDKHSRMPQVADLTENVFRTAALLRGLEVTGGDLMGARAFTMLRHGDYADLTDFEYTILRDILPFYKWLRTNLPFQMRMVFEDPAKLLFVKKAQNAVYEVRGIDAQEAKAKQPKWLRPSFTIPLGTNPDDDQLYNAMVLDLPMDDLYNGFRDYISMGLPMLRNIAEVGIGQNTFTGSPIEGKQKQLAGAFNLPVLRDLIAATPWGARDAEGNVLIDDRFENLLAGVPIYSRFRNFILSDPDRVERRMGTTMSLIFGVNMRDIDQAQLTDSELSFYYDEVEPMMNYMRELGIQFPTKDDLSPGVYAALGLQVPQAA